jgi:hypothetical protein
MHRGRADAQGPGHLLFAIALENAVQHLPLPRRQLAAKAFAAAQHAAVNKSGRWFDGGQAVPFRL